MGTFALHKAATTRTLGKTQVHESFRLVANGLATTPPASWPSVAAFDSTTSPTEIGRARAAGFLRYAIEGLYRMSIIAVCACVEAYVSGLGVDHAMRNPSL